MIQKCQMIVNSNHPNKNGVEDSCKSNGLLGLLQCRKILDGNATAAGMNRLFENVKDTVKK